MVRSFFSVIILTLFFVGCSQPPLEKTAISIGKAKITKEEFEKGFQESIFSNKGNKGKLLYLESLVSKKLMLLEAEKMGLDRNPAFIEDIQVFWEQGLLKILLAEKTKELTPTIKISDAEVKNYYNQQKAQGRMNKELGDVYGQIQGTLLKEKQNQMLLEWTASIKKSTAISVDYQDLGIAKEK